MRFRTAIASLAGLAISGCGQPAAMDPHPTYDASAFFDTTSMSLAPPGPYAFSPDNASLLVSSDRSGVFNAAALPADGGEANQLTRSPDHAVFAISYFPSDERILLASDQGGNELEHIYVRNAEGALTDLTPGDGHTSQFLGWSGDGATFWIATNERDPQMFDVYAYSTADVSRRMVFENSGYSPAAVSPDGRWLALNRPITAADSDVYLADLSRPAQQTPVLVTRDEGVIAQSVLTFTPDSRQLVYATDAYGEFSQAWAYDLATGDTKTLISADWDVVRVAYSPSGRYRVSVINEDASTRLTILDQTTGSPVALSGAPSGDISAVQFDRAEKRIAFTLASDTSPTDVFIADLGDGAARRLTTNLSPAISETALVTGEVVRYPSFDGREIPAILFRPRQAGPQTKVPAIVDVHGGPGGQSRKGYAAMYQHLINHGYAVLRVNNRGSSGYGKTFFNMDNRKHGEVDLDDVVYGKRYLETLDWIDGEKIAVLGGSYGGYMVAAALAFRPDEFAAGINIFGVTNWVRTLESIPAWWGAEKDALYDEMGDPATDAERLRRISPLFHAGNIRKPLLVVQGANDPRVLQVESDELVAAVRANAVPVEYIVFPDEGHGFLKKDNRIAASNAYLAFLNQHLKGLAPPAGVYAPQAASAPGR